ncbi:enoyl-CoA hydratase [Variovorax sp. NFACC27]|uniref:oxepin-CoA hydrolase, alternative type n=1 Tax=unclassified Variovorax TaxID=663243 RepID=UPI00089C4AB3|nr:enoyl-CoA hydratase/carnithine racemase [Variovorax paradoxus]SEF31923.1 Enoyl-CoA hydratase/carnithine racemase [Variovorax sp. NFACC28]SEG82954.1 Enoyl-CoA hydratase/carnithine racemase [Variovorax sp. NFACC29]SFD06003.1 Enoyl-CoA hydratase/carnithine racemase [Variovorax sp. NFACC26]SFG21037.1 Enoyl-CoA hydratase/carnithine racemase [Variovorax sp. NFACC27]
MSTAELKSTSEGSTMVLTISNPSQRNALGPDIYAAGIEALNKAENSAEIRSVVIVGEGSWFCAGGSLQRLLANRQLDRSVQAESIEGLHNWIDSIRTFPKPVIAAVEGAAAGAGFSLALACDFVVSARDAVFAASYSNVALSPDGGLSWHLGRQLPRQLASEWLMNGERIAAPRLHALGLVNELTESGQALAGALALAGRLNARAPNSLASIKELLSEAQGATLASQLSQERDHFVRNLHHANAGIGIAAFLEKKPPQYE